MNRLIIPVACGVLILVAVASSSTMATEADVDSEAAKTEAAQKERKTPPPGARVSGGRTVAGPDADWVPLAAAGLMVVFFIGLFGSKALKSRRESRRAALQAVESPDPTSSEGGENG
jgi:hypothetical protein